MHFQTFGPIDRDHLIFELVDDNGNVLFDVSFNNADELEVGLHEHIANRVLGFQQLLDLLAEGKRLAESSLLGAQF